MPGSRLSIVPFVVLLGCEPAGSTTTPEPDPVVEFTADADLQIYEGGGARDLSTVVVPGKVTVVDFFAEWCKPCKKIDAHMADVLRTTSGVALRKLDVIDWDSELAKQHLQNVPNLPYVIVFDAGGKKVDAISGLDLKRLDEAIARARGG